MRNHVLGSAYLNITSLSAGNNSPAASSEWAVESGHVVP